MKRAADEQVPEQHTGIQTNTESEIEFEGEEESRKFYAQARERLLRIKGWHELAGKATADFTLTDEQGYEVDRYPKEGDHFRISIPAPGTDTGEGDDWVQVQSVVEDENCISITVRPATNPLNEKRDVAHFFSEEATSTFLVKREGNKVIAGIYGRNEKPNLKTEKLKDTIRNAAVASGAITGFAKIQWKSLANGIVSKSQ
jgi:hypothetical protein